MAKLSKAEKLTRFQGRVDFAKSYREREKYDDTWKRMIDLYKGRHFKNVSDEDRIAVNLSFAAINVIFPSITVNNPQISVTANNPEDADRASVVEAVTNYWWRHFNFRDAFRAATKDFLIIGHGWVKIGWRYRTSNAPLTGEEYEAEVTNLITEADDFAAARPDLAGDMPTDDEIRANAPGSKRVVLEDQPFVERVSPFDVFVDPEATDMADLSWIAQRIVVPLEEAQEDARYNGAARRRLKATMSVNPDKPGNSSGKWNRHGSEDKRVVIWEFYDLKKNEMAVFADGSDEFLIDPMKIPYAFSNPFEPIMNFEVPDEFYPMGDLENLETIQQELNKTRTQMMNHRKKYGRKYVYRSGAFSSTGRQALEAGDDNAVIEVVDDNIPLTDVIAPVPITQMSADIYNYSDIIRQDMNMVSGVSEYQQGLMPGGRRTATEASMIQDGANARVADKLAVVEASIARIARKVLIVAQQFMTGEQVALVVGEGNAQQWLRFGWEEIRGEYDFTVEGGSTQPLDENTRRQKALAMLSSLGPFVGQVIDPHEFVKYVLQDGFGIKDPNRYLMSAPPPTPPDGGAGPAASDGAPGMEMGGAPPVPQGMPLEPGMAGVPPIDNMDTAAIMRLLQEQGVM